jgi:hypothetical protein
MSANEGPNGFITASDLVPRNNSGTIELSHSFNSLRGGCFNFLRGFGGEAVSPIIGDCLIDNGSAVDTFPGIKNQKEVREPFHHHQPFALRTIHNYFLPRYVSELAREGIAICDPAQHHRIINNLVLWELLIRTTLYTPLYLFFNFVQHLGDVRGEA